MSIHTSIGTSTADSYVSVASANTYFTARENANSWNDIDSSTNATAATTRKENLLKQATREIDYTFRFHDNKYNTGIKGADDYQALEFPRTNDLDEDGDVLIPDEVKYATYEQVLWLMERQGKRTTQDNQTLQRQIIGIDCQNYLKPYVNRQVNMQGNYPWQGSTY